MSESETNEHEQYEREIPTATRSAVLERDLFQCQVCGTGGENRLQIHHVVFRSQGGTHAASNLVTLCFRCHRLVHLSVVAVSLKLVNGVYRAFCSRTFYQ
jgi:5-methylcytosine-specific restriction endonuclease McrA